jgi:hypothetical protein
VIKVILVQLDLKAIPEQQEFQLLVPLAWEQLEQREIPELLEQLEIPV